MIGWVMPRASVSGVFKTIRRLLPKLISSLGSDLRSDPDGFIPNLPDRTYMTQPTRVVETLWTNLVLNIDRVY
jgi:hypothetical protein